MSFKDDTDKFSALVEFRTGAVFTGSVQEIHRSIQTGSELTGAPGQPVDTGALRASWQIQYLSETEAEISSGLPYAEPIENGIGPHGPLKLRSAVGGFNSVKLTIAGIQRIVAAVTKRVTGHA